MNPTDVAKLLEEDEDKPKYDKCPRCGDPYAVVGADKTFCANIECDEYDKTYAETVHAIESNAIKIEDYMNDIHEMDFNDFVNYLQLVKDGYNFTEIEIPQDGNLTGEYAVVFWHGYPHVEEKKLQEALARLINGD